MSKLQSIKYDHQTKTLDILDQLALPHTTTYVSIKNIDDGYKAIKDMVVRGAPAIAIVGALSVAVELNSELGDEAADIKKYVTERLDYLVQSRPTAVNLSLACSTLKSIVSETAPESVVEEVTKFAESMLAADVADNMAIGSHGASLVSGSAAVLTICNTGSLATAGYGTALGIIRALHTQGRLEHAYACETRPYNQGARLTAYELVVEEIPSTLITDNMAAALLRAHPEIKMIVVGADRVTKNGDTANKIGTYQLAVLASHFKSQGRDLKFVVAAPTTSIDLHRASGDEIVIEERPAHELTSLTGVDTEGVKRTVKIAADGINVWNPAFDVTPKDLIDAIVTENGVAVKNENGEFELEKFFN